MNLHEVYETLNTLAGISSRSAKEAMLADFLKDETFTNIIVLALDPFRVYGQRPALDHVPEILDLNPLPIDEQSAALIGPLVVKQIPDRTKLDPVGNLVLNRILNKDLRCGVGIKMVNAVKKGTIPTFDVMLAHRYEPKRIKTWPVDVQAKLDGMRVVACITQDEVKFLTRNGKEVTSLSHIAAQLRSVTWPWPVTWLDGEVTNGTHFNDSGAVRRKSEDAKDAIFTVFEVLPSLYDRAPHVERHARLDQLPAMDHVYRIVSTVAYNHDDILSVYRGVRRAGGEGVIVKPLDGIYEPKRSHAWLKIKDQQTLDLRVVGVFNGEPGTKYADKLGGVVVDHKGVEVRVGSGFSDAEREDLDWVGRVIEVEFHEVTPDGSLRHPRFVKRREDLE